MKMMKKMLAVALAVVMVAGFTGCGEISYEDITGEWTTKTIDDKPVEQYAKELGTTKAMAATNMKITEDNKLVAENAAATQTYVYERKADGIEVKEEGKEDILFSMAYDSEAKTFSYKMDLGNGQTMTFVMEKGTTDLTAPKETKKKK